jgi:hypothetical protein
MYPMRRGITVLFFLALAGVGAPISAQQNPGPGGGLGLYGVGPRLGENIQLAVGSRETLGLSGEQVEALQELGVGVQRDVAPLELEIETLRTRIIDGEIAWATGVGQLQDLFAQYETAAAPYRTGIAGILTAQQHQALQEMMFETRFGSSATVRLGRAGLGRGRGLGVGAGLPARGLGLGPVYRRLPVVGRGMGRRGGRGFGRGFARSGWRYIWDGGSPSF